MGRYVILLCLVLCSFAAAQKTSKNKDKTVSQVDGKIVGGQNANINDFMYQVVIGQYKDYKDGSISFGSFCGGSILDQQHILTAAHCLIPKPDPQDGKLVIRAFSNETFDQNGVMRYVSEIITHHGYNDVTYDNDIAILVLDAPLPYRSPSQFVKLSYNIPREGDYLLLSGWGALWEGQVGGSRHLQSVMVPYINQTSCAKIYGRRWTANMICAGDEKGKVQDSCQGDSGGPAVLVRGGKYRQGRHQEQVGVVSWGIGCARRGYPGVYANIAKYQKWIEDNLDGYRSTCDNDYAELGGIPSRMRCAGQPGKDSCQGDSGSPVVKNNESVGVVSWGIGYARQGYPGAYTNFANPTLRTWIRNSAGV